MRKAWLLVALVLVAGCDRSRDELKVALAETQRVSAEKDSLLNEIVETTKLVSDINSELSKARNVGVRPVVASETKLTPAAEDRTVLLGKIQEVVARLNDSEAKLEKTQQRLAAMTKKDRRLIAQVEEYKKTLTELRETTERQKLEYEAIIEQQRMQIVTLQTDLDTARAVNVALADTVANLTDYSNTVYVVSGTKKELEEKGVVVNEGSKFLFFGGKKLMPARNLPTDAFATINKVRDTVITLPKAEKDYRIVSRHDTAYVDAAAEKDGRFRGEIHITSPDRFWASSKYLILVEN